MPVPTDITAGTLTITNGSTAVTGVGTSWLASDLRQGDVILWIEGGDGFQTPILADVPTSNTALTLVESWEGPTLTGVRYRIRYQWDSSRVSAQSRQLIEMLDNGNVLALSGLTGPGIPVFDGPHSMVIKPESDFIDGVAYDVQVNTLADRATYDGQTAGFSVLVSDVGDGRSAIYSKASNSSGDWTDAAYVTGPVGAASTVPGVTWQGTYAGGTAYVANDGVLYNGSSWRAKIATTGNAPPALPTTSNTWWELLARAGIDGAGTVNAITAGAGVSVDSTDPTQPVVTNTGVHSIVGGVGISIDSTDPTQPVVNQKTPPAYAARFGTVLTGNDALLTGVLTDEGVPGGWVTSILGAGGGTLIVIPETGVYLIGAGTANRETPPSSLEIQVRANGSVVLASAFAPASAGSYALCIISSFAVKLTAGDYVHLRCSGGETYGSSTYNMFSIARI